MAGCKHRRKIKAPDQRIKTFTVDDACAKFGAKVKRDDPNKDQAHLSERGVTKFRYLPATKSWKAFRNLDIGDDDDQVFWPGSYDAHGAWVFDPI